VNICGNFNGRNEYLITLLPPKLPDLGGWVCCLNEVFRHVENSSPDSLLVLSDTDKVGPPPPQVYHPPILSNTPVPSFSGAKENTSACPYIFCVHRRTNGISSSCELITITPEFLNKILFLYQPLHVVPTDRVLHSLLPVRLPIGSSRYIFAVLHTNVAVIP
jgi:hypothetical protein